MCVCVPHSNHSRTRVWAARGDVRSNYEAIERVRKLFTSFSGEFSSTNVIKHTERLISHIRIRWFSFFFLFAMCFLFSFLLFFFFSLIFAQKNHRMTFGSCLSFLKPKILEIFSSRYVFEHRARSSQTNRSSCQAFPRFQYARTRFEHLYESNSSSKELINENDRRKTRKISKPIWNEE